MKCLSGGFYVLILSKKARGGDVFFKRFILLLILLLVFLFSQVYSSLTPEPYSISSGIVLQMSSMSSVVTSITATSSRN